MATGLTPNNDDRAERAADALRRYVQITGSETGDALSDLLSDLMHWADARGRDFDADLGRARLHHAAEAAEAALADKRGTRESAAELLDRVHAYLVRERQRAWDAGSNPYSYDQFCAIDIVAQARECGDMRFEHKTAFRAIDPLPAEDSRLPDERDTCDECGRSIRVDGSEDDHQAMDDGSELCLSCVRTLAR